MKNLIYIFGLFMALSSCSDTLDIENIDSYNPDAVWNDESLATAYLANLYPLFGNWDAQADRLSEQLAGIEWYPDRITISNGSFKYWDYDTIRLINQALVGLEEGTLPQQVKDKIKGQVLFMRAYVYFKMVKYHGGVPYLKKPLDRYEDELNVPRNSTQECFDFIEQDIDAALALLPEHINTASGDYGKIDGNFALAFKAKVLLYKASPQFNPTNPWDNSYWQQANAVNKEAYESLLAQGYGLVEDYANIALEEGNKEVVFSVINSYPNKTASWDHGVRPGSESRGAASACPTWEFVKQFPMKDGRLYNDPQGAYQMSDQEFLQNYWQNRDPRFDKSIVWNGKIYEVSGKTGKRQYTSLGIAHELDDFGVNPNANTNSTNLDRYTGFFIVKNSLLQLTQAEVQQYDVDFVVMRFAEVMLNYAETANETGNSALALDLLRQLRERAGIEPGTDGSFGITAVGRQQVREAILAERSIELCFEGHRFWDLRRLRFLDRLDGTTKSGVEAIAIQDDGSEMEIGQARTLADTYQLVEDDFKYSILQVPLSGVKVSSLPETYYFFPIQKDVLDRNPALEQNKAWGGTFDPTLP